MTLPVRIRVPATTSNLGPGFDTLGMALQIYNTLTVSPATETSVHVHGEGADELPRDATNVIVQTIATVFDAAGLPMPHVRLDCEHAIPPARGLGSSASAIVAALFAADAMIQRPSDTLKLLAQATQIEGHPDNAAPALLGGLQVAARLEDGRVLHAGVRVGSFPSVVLFIPEMRMPTADARAVLPAHVSRADTVHNISRTALLIAALASGRDELLDEATRDALHQGPRTRIFPALPRLLRAAREAGALGAWLSGAGSTVAAFARNERADLVADAFRSSGRELGVPGRVVVTDVDTVGVTVEPF